MTELEMLVEKEGPSGVLMQLSSVCFAKATHILETYQNEPLAARWEKAGSAIDSVMGKVHKSLPYHIRMKPAAIPPAEAATETVTETPETPETPKAPKKKAA